MYGMGRNRIAVARIEGAPRYCGSRPEPGGARGVPAGQEREAQRAPGYRGSRPEPEGARGVAAGREREADREQGCQMAKLSPVEIRDIQALVALRVLVQPELLALLAFLQAPVEIRDSEALLALRVLVQPALLASSRRVHDVGGGHVPRELEIYAAHHELLVFAQLVDERAKRAKRAGLFGHRHSRLQGRRCVRRLGLHPDYGTSHGCVHACACDAGWRRETLLRRRMLRHDGARVVHGCPMETQGYFAVPHWQPRSARSLTLREMSRLAQCI